MENYKTNVRSDYIGELREQFSHLNFNRIENTDGLYVTDSENLDMSNDPKLFKETQVKRILSNCSRLQKKLSYFSQDEDASKIYKFDDVQDLKAGENFVIQNIGHATQLIQISDFNILTDPVFNDLNCLLYPAKTKSHPVLEKLPRIDIVLISHNHRDHTDKNSLADLLRHQEENRWHKPKIFVPLGDKTLFKNFGFNEVEEVDWYTKITLEDINGMNKINFISIPANHRSGRYYYDHHRSVVTGWLINPETDNVIFKYSGDTKALSDEEQKATDAVLWYEIKSKYTSEAISYDNFEIPDIICFEPSGPNYTRCYMNITHQSTSYSALLKFIEAENLAKLSGRNLQEFLHKIKTIMMHHNKFELGPDRFNEGLFVFKKLLQYLDPKTNLEMELEKQRNKLKQNLDKESLRKNTSFMYKPLIATLPEQTSLLVHAKDFIILEIQEVTNKGIDKEQMKEYLIKNTIFPKIGERLNTDQIGNTKFNEENIKKYRGEINQD